ncbi:hypothetical protein [Cupriavidus metallidurans]|jgi:hypothetical protein|uniref:Uncharacterized protein n=1 Tax=Cupriavidus metallidurans TaxID=119219 RepID=A0A482IUD2_9BURK|nr:hypothetical protein [Cupriavidus metallidurans]QBP10450.1 hypothetical protein DDF84_012160 [Cupriavidus metallidurans]QWC87527.1 hypothetical protein KB891_10715 [Cupriavidus metallidurans]
MTSRSDADRFGFRSEEIYAFLETHGLKLTGQQQSAARSATPVERVPEWARPYVGRRQISLGDAATILAGLPPAYVGNRSDEEYAEFQEWRKALLDAIGPDNDPTAEISASTWSANQDAEQLLSHSDIRAWCSHRGHVWPIPEPAASQPRTSSVSSELAKRLEAIEADLAQWAQEDPRVADLMSASHAYAELWKESKEEAKNLRAQLAANEGERDEWKLRAYEAIAQAEHLTQLETEARARIKELSTASSRKDQANTPAEKADAGSTGGGITVQLPYITKGLTALFSVMREQWSDYDKNRQPKSAIVARAIDAALGYKQQSSGEPSRNGQSLAALIRPDEIREADLRVTKR